MNNPPHRDAFPFMNGLRDLYRRPLALLTDLYELTMAAGYWTLGMADREAAFTLFFRKNPFHGGFAVACGLAQVLEYLDGFRFDETDLDYLASLPGTDGTPLFTKAFLEALGDLELRCTVDAVPEGTVVFPHEPLLVVTGPLMHCQILETALLNLLNFQTLIASKAARVCLAAEGDPVIEFGLRRAQGIDGGVTAARASYVGGCAGTSNVLAGRLFDIPVKGTHAHSWVMVFEDELEAFHAYAKALPNNSIFLVDTYDTLEGVRHAVAAGRQLRERGYEMAGIRLDSGDLTSLSVAARTILDEAGFEGAKILASGDLDEHLIGALKEKGAPIELWGVGTRLATAYDDPALGGVYKLTAVKDGAGRWDYRVKVSEQEVKSTTPGVLQVRRFSRNGRFLADAVYDRQLGPGSPCEIVDFAEASRRTIPPADARWEDLLVRVFEKGKRVLEARPLHQARERTLDQLSRLPAGVKKLEDPEPYAAGLEGRLHALKRDLMAEALETERKGTWKRSS